MHDLPIFFHLLQHLLYLFCRIFGRFFPRRVGDVLIAFVRSYFESKNGIWNLLDSTHTYTHSHKTVHICFFSSCFISMRLFIQFPKKVRIIFVWPCPYAEQWTVQAFADTLPHISSTAHTNIDKSETSNKWRHSSNNKIKKNERTRQQTPNQKVSACLSAECSWLLLL